MDLNSIRNALKEQPFRPFDLCLADGRRVLVKHPEFVAMNQRIVIVTDEESATKILEPLLHGPASVKSLRIRRTHGQGDLVFPKRFDPLSSALVFHGLCEGAAEEALFGRIPGGFEMGAPGQTPAHDE